MKLVIDNMTSLTGWSASGGATVHGLNEIPQYIAGVGNTKSVIFKFNGLNSYVQKTFAVNVTDYTEIVFSIGTTNKKNNTYRKAGDFAYKIDFGTGKEYYLPVYSSFTDVTIDVSDLTSIDRIKITALHGDLDYLVMSYVVAVMDNVPYDIFEGIQESVEWFRDNFITNQISIGTISGSAGAKTITFAAEVNYLDRYYAIKIVSGSGTEYHTIQNKNGLVFALGKLYDGESLKYTHTSATVYIWFPVRFGNLQREIIIPSISIWGFGNSFINRTGELAVLRDTWKTGGTVAERYDGKYVGFNILIDCEADKEVLMEHITTIVRRTIGNEKIWVLGRKVDINFSGDSNELLPAQSFDIIPKVQFPCTVEIKEELFDRASAPVTTEVDLDVYINN